MGTRDVSLLATGAFGAAGSLSGIDSIHQNVDLFTVRVNYRFGGPVVARY
jgi:outer membrane immunogenic protein